MAAGADKLIRYDPPGAFGLFDRLAKFLIRFDEVDTATRPQDALGVCNDFDEVLTSAAMPSVVPAVLGRGRLFNAADTGLAARDKVSGSTLITRDATIQVVLAWDASAQNAGGTPGTVIARGTGGSSAEYVSYGLRIDVVDVPTFTALVRWFWQDTAGVLHLQTGAQVCMKPNAYTMLTATRRWVSPTEVQLRYYVGDLLIGEVTSTDGSIGGGTTGAMQLGHRVVAGAPDEFFAGVIDEVMVLDRELTAEEVEATWLRLTFYQPLGVELFRDQIEDGFPISDEPDSDVQLDIRMQGMVLGLVGANAETVRNYFIPQRAFGSTLEQWEKAVGVTPKPVQGIEERRARVVARLRQKRGISIPGLKDALRDLIDCDVDDLEFIAYSNHIVDGFDTAIEPQLWDFTPNPSATWNAGKARFAPGAGTFTAPYSWQTIARVVSQPGRPDLDGLEHVLAKLVISTPQNNFEAGVWFGNKAAGNYLLLGLRQDGVFKIITESFLGHVSQGAVVQATPGVNPAAIWFHLFEHAAGAWTASWSTTSATAGFTSSAPITHPTLVHWAGCYVRSIAAVGAPPVADFDDFQLFTPNGTRPFNAYVLRDPGLGGAPDVEGASSVIQAIAHGYTHAAFITSRAVLSADPSTPCDRGPMGVL